MAEYRVLLVDDDDHFRERLGRALRERGFVVETMSNPLHLRTHKPEEPLDGALIDLVMPGGSGLEVVRELRERHPQARLIVLTGYGSIASALEAVRLGAADYLTKPVDADQVADILRGQRSLPRRTPTAPTLDRLEWEHIQRVLLEAGGNISETARILGIDRRSLQRKLAKLAPLR